MRGDSARFFVCFIVFCAKNSSNKRRDYLRKEDVQEGIVCQVYLMSAQH